MDDDCGAHEIALMLLPIAGADMGLMVDGCDNGFSA